MMVWYKNTIIEVKQKHLMKGLSWEDTIALSVLDHFDEMNNVLVYDDVVGLFFNDEQGQPIGVEVKNELIPTFVPFKFIIEENPDDYWGTCTAKNLPCNRIPVQQPVANNKCVGRVSRPSPDEAVSGVCGAEGR